MTLALQLKVNSLYNKWSCTTCCPPGQLPELSRDKRKRLPIERQLDCTIPGEQHILHEPDVPANYYLVQRGISGEQFHGARASQSVADCAFDGISSI